MMRGDNGADAKDAASCANCGVQLSGAYCARCGQSAHEGRPPTIQYFFHDLTHEILHVDGKIFRSLSALLFRPGLLPTITRWSRRAVGLGEIRLFLIAAALHLVFAPGIGPLNLRFEAYRRVDTGQLEFLGLLGAWPSTRCQLPGRWSARSGSSCSRASSAPTWRSDISRHCCLPSSAGGRTGRNEPYFPAAFDRRVALLFGLVPAGNRDRMARPMNIDVPTDRFGQGWTPRVGVLHCQTVAVPAK